MVASGAFALAAFVTLDATFSDVFSGSLRLEIAEQLGNLGTGQPPECLKALLASGVYLLVAVSGGAVGGIAYRLFSCLIGQIQGNSRG